MRAAALLRAARQPRVPGRPEEVRGAPQEDGGQHGGRRHDDPTCSRSAPDDPVGRAANIMVDKKVNRVPVVDDGRAGRHRRAARHHPHAGALACSTTGSAPWPRSTSRPCATTSPTSSAPAARRRARCAPWSRPTATATAPCPSPGRRCRPGRRGWAWPPSPRPRSCARRPSPRPCSIFGPLTGAELARAARAHADVAVWSQAFLAEALRCRARVHVKFNSGMGRLGRARARRRAPCAAARRRRACRAS